MDINAYIQSGIIESYVLGLATPEETAEIEKLRLQYPELEQALNDFAVSLESVLLKQAVEPPFLIKDGLMALIKQEKSTPVVPLITNSTKAQQTPEREKFVRPWSMLAAASVILLIVSAGFNIYFYNKYSQTSKDYQSLLAERTSLLATNQAYQTKLNSWQNTIEMLGNPEMASITMKDPGGKNNYLATVLWNTKSKQVFLIPGRLPAPSEGKQYQLWAMVDGKPVDAGMLDTECTGACEMKIISQAEAFAITLEKKGGSPTPDLSSLFVLGTV